MSESAGKRRKRYVDHPKYRYKKLVSSTETGIHQMNERPWRTLVIRIFN